MSAIAVEPGADCGDHELPVDANGYCADCRTEAALAASADARTEIAVECEKTLAAIDSLAVDCIDGDDGDDADAVAAARVLVERAAELMRGRWYRPIECTRVVIEGLERTEPRS